MLHVFIAGLMTMSTLGAGDTPADKLASACQGVTSAESYTVKVTVKSEGDSFPGFGGPPPGEADQPTVGEYQKSQPTHFKRGDTEAFKTKSQTIYKAGSEPWTAIDSDQGSGGEGFRRRGDGESGRGGADEPGGEAGERSGRRGRGGDGAGEPGEAGPDGKNERGGGRPDGFARSPRMDAMMLANTRLPHQLFTDLQTKVADVKTETKDGMTVYVAQLTKEGAQALGSGGPGRGRSGRGPRDGGPDGGGSDSAGRSGGAGGSGGPGGAGGPGGERREPEYTGVLRVATNAAGQVEKIEIDTHSKFFMGDREINRSRTATYELSNVNKTHVEVPKEAQAHMKNV